MSGFIQFPYSDAGKCRKKRKHVQSRMFGLKPRPDRSDCLHYSIWATSELCEAFSSFSGMRLGCPGQQNLLAGRLNSECHYQLHPNTGSRPQGKHQCEDLLVGDWHSINDEQLNFPVVTRRTHVGRGASISFLFFEPGQRIKLDLSRKCPYCNRYARQVI